MYNFRAISGCSLMVCIPHLPTSQRIKPKFITVQPTGCFLTRQKCPPQHVCPSLAAPVSTNFSPLLQVHQVSEPLCKLALLQEYPPLPPLCGERPSFKMHIKYPMLFHSFHPSRCISNIPCSSTAFTVLPPPPSSVQIHCSPHRDPEDISSFLCG